MDGQSSEGCFASFRDSLILLSRSAANSDGAYHFAVPLQRNAAREDHHASVVGDVDAEKLVPGLTVSGQFLRRDIEGPGRPGLVNRDIDAADPGIIHSHVSDQVPAAIDYGDIHRLAYLPGF